MPGKMKPVTKTLHGLGVAEVKRAECKNAHVILEQMHKSCRALFIGYRNTRYLRNIHKRFMEGQDLEDVTLRLPRGMTTDEEQDLLRSMLVMAASGLDAMAKQLIRDALPSIAASDERAAQLLEKSIQKAVMRIADKTAGGSGFLARVLTAPSTRGQVIEEYIQELTRGSLQSVEELWRVVAALGISDTDIPVDQTELREAFGVRNQIVHELDINLEAPRRNRNARKQSDMLRAANCIMEVGEFILQAVDSKLEQPGTMESIP